MHDSAQCRVDRFALRGRLARSPGAHSRCSRLVFHTLPRTTVQSRFELSCAIRTDVAEICKLAESASDVCVQSCVLLEMTSALATRTLRLSLLGAACDCVGLVICAYLLCMACCARRVVATRDVATLVAHAMDLVMSCDCPCARAERRRP